MRFDLNTFTRRYFACQFKQVGPYFTFSLIFYTVDVGMQHASYFYAKLEQREFYRRCGIGEMCKQLKKKIKHSMYCRWIFLFTLIFNYKIFIKNRDLLCYKLIFLLTKLSSKNSIEKLVG